MSCESCWYFRQLDEQEYTEVEDLDSNRQPSGYRGVCGLSGRVTRSRWSCNCDFSQFTEVDRQESGEIVLVTSVDDYGNEIVTSEPSPGAKDDNIEAIWLGKDEGYTRSLVSGNQYPFLIVEGRVLSQSPGSRYSDKHTLAVAEAWASKAEETSATTTKVIAVVVSGAEEQEGRKVPADSEEHTIFLTVPSEENVIALLRAINVIRPGYELARWTVVDETENDDWF